MRSAFRRKGKTRRFVNRFRFILVCFLALGFLCGGSEYLSARLLSAPDGGPREWHLTRPSAYWFSPYWSPKLVEEQYSTTNDIGNDGLPTLRDFHGSYINIDGGIRGPP